MDQLDLLDLFESPKGSREEPSPTSPEASEQAAAPRSQAPKRRAPKARPAGAPLFEDGGGYWRRPRSVVLHEEARRRYLNYALSVITSRALPDVRDGLKPVQRRILYVMYKDLKLLAGAKPRKSAAVVGEVMGRYHPHGDSAIYDAMVRMAQGFNLRYPLVDGHGNFGSMDGDPPAAMRYTEARLQELAHELLQEIDQDTVPWRPTYDGSREEPIVLPARFPNLLVNGVSGIAVGMATQIPPHNLGEVADACLALLQDPDLPDEDLFRLVPGPDFPTGGEIMDSPDHLADIYRKGKGTVHLRAVWHEERIDRRDCVVVTEIPYQVNKASLIEKIAGVIVDRKLPQLVDVRDESTDEVRIVLELKRGAEAEDVMAFLFRHTPLQHNFHVNLTCLVPTEGDSEVCVPMRVGLRDMLRAFLDFRQETVVRRTRHELGKLEARIHILEGFEAIFVDIHEAVRIVLASRNRKEAAQGLMERFGIDQDQADAILETRLYRLARMEIEAVRGELADKRRAAAELAALLDDPRARTRLVAQELRDVAGRFADERRTRFGEGGELRFDPERYLVKEDTWVIVTRDGWVKRQGSFSDVGSIRLKEGATLGWVLETDTLSTVTFFTSMGKAYTLRVDSIKATSGYGEPIQVHFDFTDRETVIGVVANDPACRPPKGEFFCEDDEPGEGPDAGRAENGRGRETEGESHGGAEGLGRDGSDQGAPLTEMGPREPEYQGVAVTRFGKGLRFDLASFSEVSNRGGRRYCRLGGRDAEQDEVIAVWPSTGGELVSLATTKGRAALFPVKDLKLLRGAGKGVTAIKLESGDQIFAFELVRSMDEGVMVRTTRGREVVVGPRGYRISSRGGKGIQIIKRGGLEGWRQRAPVVRARPEAKSVGDDTQGPADGLEPGQGPDGEAS